MANPSITFLPYSGYSVPVVSVYADQTSLLTSANSGRQNYSVLTDVYINGNDVATLKSYPLNGIMQVNPQKTAENYLLHNFNYNCVGVADNPDSIKSIYTINGEQFSRIISFSSVTDYAGFVQLNLISEPTINTGDRIYITLDNTSINPQYNTYAKVLNVTGANLITDLPFVSVPNIITGHITEGAEFYDLAYSNGVLSIITTNPHNLNVGDEVFIQMDTVATGKFKFNSGTAGSVDSIMIGTENILSTSIPFDTSISQTITDIVADINNHTDSTGYSAYHWNTSDIFHVYSLRWSGQSTTGLAIYVSTSGDLSIASSPAMFSDNRIDAATGEGWNPQFMGTYPVTSIVSATEFSTNIAAGYNDEPGSQRGSIIGMNNYVFTGITTGDTYYIMNNNNRYDYTDYAATITGFTYGSPSARFLTNKERTTFPYLDLAFASKYDFYSTNDIATVDILYQPSTSEPVQYMFVQTFSGSNVHTGDYFINLSSYTASFSTSTDWKRISFGVGAWNLNQIPHSEFAPITPPPSGNIIKEVTTMYAMNLYSGDTVDDIFNGWLKAEGLIFNRKCTSHKYFELIWLNKWGAFDYYPVTGNYEEAVNVTRTMFERKRESVMDANHYGFSPLDRGFTDFNVKSSRTIKLNTDWLNLAQSEWIAEVFESPQVYLYEPQTGNPNQHTALYPVNVMDTQIIKPNERSTMKAYTINVQLSSRKINQKN